MARAKKTAPDAAGRAMPLTRRGFGYLRQLPSGKWQASFMGPDRARHKAPHTFGKKVQAEMWLTKVFDEIQAGKWKGAGDKNTFGVYAVQWLAARRRRDGKELAAGTKSNYADYIENLKSTKLFDADLPSINAPMLRQIHAELTTHSGATTAARHSSFIRSVLNTAERDGLIGRNPMPSELCSTSTGIFHRNPTDDELDALIEVMVFKFKLAICLDAYGGARKSEWRALLRSDLPKVGDYHVVDINKQAVYKNGRWQITDPKSDRGFRQVALPKWMNPMIEAHLESVPKSTDPNALLFPAARAEFVDGEWERAWLAARKAVGVKGQVRGHDLRHYYGTALAKGGASSLKIQAAMGHANVSQSAGYVHLAKGAATELADLFPDPSKRNSPSE